MKKASDYLKVSLHGMNDHAYKMMSKYLEMCCNDIARVVEDSKADAEIIDVDLAQSKTFLEERLAQQPSKPIIALSVQEVSFDNVVYVKKPIDIPSIVAALKTVKKQVLRDLKKTGGNRVTQVPLASSPAKPSEIILEPEEETLIQENISDSLEPEIKETKIQEMISDNLEPEIKETKIQDKVADSIEPEIIEIEKAVNTFVGSVPKWTQRKKSDLHVTKEITKADKKKQKNEPHTDDTLASIDLSISETNSPNDESEPILSETSAIHLREIDRLLKELHEASENTNSPENPSFSSEKETKDSKQKNNRKTIRYAFHPIEAKLKKNSVMGLNINQTVLVLNISSKGAIIELKKPTKLSGKMTLTIHFDSQNVFIIPARIVRKEGKIIYGLHFLNFQHDLTDFLVNSGRSFFFS